MVSTLTGLPSCSEVRTVNLCLVGDREHTVWDTQSQKKVALHALLCSQDVVQRNEQGREQ